MHFYWFFSVFMLFSTSVSLVCFDFPNFLLVSSSFLLVSFILLFDNKASGLRCDDDDNKPRSADRVFSPLQACVSAKVALLESCYGGEVRLGWREQTNVEFVGEYVGHSRMLLRLLAVGEGGLCRALIDKKTMGRQRGLEVHHGG